MPKLEGGAEVGDYITADLQFHRDGQVLNEAKEIQFRLQPELRFQDGHVPDVAKALTGVRPGESRETDAKIGSGSADPSLRGQTIRVTFQVHDLKRLRMPEVDAAFLELDRLRRARTSCARRSAGSSSVACSASSARRSAARCSTS